MRTPEITQNFDNTVYNMSDVAPDPGTTDLDVPCLVQHCLSYSPSDGPGVDTGLELAGETEADPTGVNELPSLLGARIPVRDKKYRNNVRVIQR